MSSAFLAIKSYSFGHLVTSLIVLALGNPLYINDIPKSSTLTTLTVHSQIYEILITAL
jgi:hypothetical protein